MLFFFLGFVSILLLIFCGFEILSYFKIKSMISLINDGTSRSSYRNRFNYNYHSELILEFIEKLTNNNFSVLKFSSTPKFLIITKNSFFEKGSFLYKIEIDEFSNQVLCEVFKNNFNYFISKFEREKKALVNLKIIEKIISTT